MTQIDNNFLSVEPILPFSLVLFGSRIPQKAMGRLNCSVPLVEVVLSCDYDRRGNPVRYLEYSSVVSLLLLHFP